MSNLISHNLTGLGLCIRCWYCTTRSTEILVFSTAGSVAGLNARFRVFLTGSRSSERRMRGRSAPKSKFLQKFGQRTPCIYEYLRRHQFLVRSLIKKQNWVIRRHSHNVSPDWTWSWPSGRSYGACCMTLKSEISWSCHELYRAPKAWGSNWLSSTS